MGLSFDYFEQYTGTVWRVESSWTFKELVARATVDPAKKGGCISYPPDASEVSARAC